MSKNDVWKVILYTGISIILSVFVLTGCSQGSSGIIGLHREPETIVIDLSEWPQQEIISSMPEIKQYDHGGLKVEIQSQEEYAAWISQLENFRSYDQLYMYMKETDVVIYLDEILVYGNFKILTINNGGKILARDISEINMDMLERIEFNNIHSIDKGLISCIPRQTKLWIDMDEYYEGEPPELELLLGIDCQNIMMVQRQGKGVETSVLMKEQDALEAELKEWDMLRAVMIEKQKILCGYCRQVNGDYNYTEYEFCDPDTMDISEAYICIKDQKSNGRQYFDVISIPKERMEYVLHVDRSRIWLEDLNFDKYTDITFIGHSSASGTYDCVYYLWNESEKKYELDTILQTRRPVNTDEARKRLTYYETDGAGIHSEEIYYIYEYTGERFREKKLRVVCDYSPEEQRGSWTWYYYEDGELVGKLEWFHDENEDISYVIYEENGERVEEVQINEKVHYYDIGLKYFPEFDFYRMG
ncbi:MAG: hypothetical protein K2I96_13380 [Lachnospiraceae bacterium]|nr:hypothetical protein [Lachnospiraceae bacterium]